MSHTYEDYQELLEKKAKDKLNGQRPQLEYLKQAQVKMELLTGDPHWDTFLSYLQNALEGLRLVEERFEKELIAPDLVDHGDIMKVKHGLVQVSAQINLLEGILALPKDIIESGEKAKALL